MDSTIPNEPIHTSQVAVRPVDIQLTGKHLAFLFIAAAVVSVVIFLGGVVVGRTQRGPALTPAASSPTAKSPQAVPAPSTLAREAEFTSPAAPPPVNANASQLETTTASPERLESNAPKTGTPPGRRRGTGHRRTRSHTAAHRGRSGQSVQ